MQRCSSNLAAWISTYQVAPVSQREQSALKDLHLETAAVSHDNNNLSLRISGGRADRVLLTTAPVQTRYPVALSELLAHEVEGCMQPSPSYLSPSLKKDSLDRRALSSGGSGRKMKGLRGKDDSETQQERSEANKRDAEKCLLKQFFGFQEPDCRSSISAYATVLEVKAICIDNTVVNWTDSGGDRPKDMCANTYRVILKHSSAPVALYIRHGPKSQPCTKGVKSPDNVVLNKKEKPLSRVQIYTKHIFFTTFRSDKQQDVQWLVMVAVLEEPSVHIPEGI
ncbi:hypothetical protein QQF64_006926 [Cirrhinus molitorella]|uniref:Uncharacterized protein n=1 Tax=Cirrhinus molitorella TaxID=172907 RepID=A0ABR3MBH8_9TELE